MKRLALTVIAVSLVAGSLAAGCSMTPTVTRERTTMTPAQIASMDLVCREIVPIDTNIPKTICASEASWAAYDRTARLASEELFEKAREVATSRF